MPRCSGGNVRRNRSSKDSTTALGVALNENLRWDTHVGKIVARARRVAARLRRLKACGMPLSVMVLAYNAFFLPIIRYCIVVWGATYLNVLSRVSTVQND